MNIGTTLGLKNLNNLAGGLASSAVSFAFTGNATFNILNLTDFGSRINGGLLEFTIGKDGISSKIGNGGTNISYSNIKSSIAGIKEASKVTDWKYGSLESRSTMNSINMLAYTNSKDNLKIAKDIWNENLEVEYGNTGNDYGNYTLGQNKIVLSETLLGGGREASAKLATVMSHEGTHYNGKRVEAYAHLAGAETYAFLNNKFTLQADTSFSMEMLSGIMNTDNWKENTGDVDHWKFTKDGNILWDGSDNLYDEDGKLLHEYSKKENSHTAALAEALGITKEEATQMLKNADYRWDKNKQTFVDSNGKDVKNDLSKTAITSDKIKIKYDFQHNYLDKLNGAPMYSAVMSFQNDMILGKQNIKLSSDFYKSNEYSDFILSSFVFANEYDKAMEKYGNVGKNKITNEIYNNIYNQANLQSNNNILYQYLEDGVISPVVGKNKITTKAFYGAGLEHLGINEGDLHSQNAIAVDLGTFQKNLPVVSLFNSDFYVNNSYGSTVGGGNYISLYSNGLKIDYKHLQGNSSAYSTMYNLNNYANNVGLWTLPVPSNYQIGNVGNSGTLSSGIHLHLEVSKRR